MQERIFQQEHRLLFAYPILKRSSSRRETLAKYARWFGSKVPLSISRSTFVFSWISSIIYNPAFKAAVIALLRSPCRLNQSIRRKFVFLCVSIQSNMICVLRHICCGRILPRPENSIMNLFSKWYYIAYGFADLSNSGNVIQTGAGKFLLRSNQTVVHCIYSSSQFTGDRCFFRLFKELKLLCSWYDPQQMEYMVCFCWDTH